MLLTARKRKRPRNELEEEEAKEKRHYKEVEEMTHTIYSLKQKIDEYEQLNIEDRDNTKKLAKLFDMGIIDENGDPVKQFASNMDYDQK